MARKFVRYNGGTESYRGCTNPTELVLGKKYEVIHESVGAWQTDYTLKDVKGSFNSCWFDDVPSTFVAVADSVPVVGERLHCSKVEFVNGSPVFIPLKSSIVTEVMDMGSKVYGVSTGSGSLYIVQVK